MKSWEVLREAADRIGVKALAARLNLSTALVYKWCQENPRDEPGSSGARNPLDRLKEILDATEDERIVNWLCGAGGGFFVKNPHVEPGEDMSRVAHAAARELDGLARLVGAERVEVGRRGGLARSLAREVAALPG